MLTPGDREIMEFFGLVQDQSVNMTPNGTADGKVILIPNMVCWEAVCNLYAIPQESRRRLVEGARLLFDGVNELIRIDGSLFRIPLEELMEPDRV